MCSGRVRNFFSTSGTDRVTQKTKLVYNCKRKGNSKIPKGQTEITKSEDRKYRSQQNETKNNY